MIAARECTGGVAFLADQMLARVARHLRLLGYDCELTNHGRSDEALVRFARDHGRVLLTCARALATVAPDAVVVLPVGDNAAVVREVIRRWPIDFAASAFTRCCVCNIPVEPLAPAQAVNRVPARVLQDAVPLTSCPRCNRVYWEGGHVARIRESFAQLYGIG